MILLLLACHVLPLAPSAAEVRWSWAGDPVVSLRSVVLLDGGTCQSLTGWITVDGEERRAVTVCSLDGDTVSVLSSWGGYVAHVELERGATWTPLWGGLRRP